MDNGLQDRIGKALLGLRARLEKNLCAIPTIFVLLAIPRSVVMLSHFRKEASGPETYFGVTCRLYQRGIFLGN